MTVRSPRPEEGLRSLPYFVELEQEFDVTRLIVGGIHAWPVLRAYLQPTLLQMMNRVHTAGVRPTYLYDAGGLLASARRCVNAARVCQPADAERSEAGRERPEALLFSTSYCLDPVGGVWYDRFLDPLAEELWRNGYRARIFEYVLTEKVLRPRRTHVRYVNHRIIPHVLRGYLNFEARRVAAETVRLYDELCRKWLSFQLPKPLPPLRWLARRVGMIRAASYYFKKEIERYQARFGMVVCYYTLLGQSFVLACNEQNIPAVDVQHGLQIGDHGAYMDWTNVPSNGYRTLPTVFWCWSHEESDAINDWAHVTRGAHRAIVGGHIWDEYCRTHEMLSGLTPRVRQALEAKWSSGDTHVLVSLSPNECDNSPLIAAVMQAAPARCVWWLRLHPQRRDRAAYEEVGSYFEGKGRVCVQEASETPLPVLLSFMDLHITANSSVVIEAAMHGVPSIITYSEYANTYRREIRQGLARVETAAAPIAQLVARARDRRSRSGIGGAAGSGIAEGLGRIQELVECGR